MDNEPNIECDERTVAVANAGGIWAFNFLSFALLIDVACRGFFFKEDAWDLMALVFVAGFIFLGYQYWHKTMRPSLMSRKRIILYLVGMIVAAIVAAILGAIMPMIRPI
jgi:hypothetical protein